MDPAGPHSQAKAHAPAQWSPLSRQEAMGMARIVGPELDEIRARAMQLRDAGRGRRVSYSRKAFFPVTNLCRDRCAYCTFRRDEGEDGAWTMTPDEIREWAERSRTLGCFEALLCLGDQPEAISPAYRRFLAEQGHGSTIEYVARASEICLSVGLLPHSNPGIMTASDMRLLKPANASLGMMLETTSERLRGKGHAHYYAPDKDPGLRLRVLEDAGRESVPFTTGILIGIGETHEERVEALLAIAEIDRRYHHVQEVIVQNFRSKPEIPMATADEPDEEDLARTIALARLILGPEANIQIPPNLAPDSFEYLLDSGINDFGGISPLTPDYVNPEAPWPHLSALARRCASAGYTLIERLPIYEEYIDRPGFLDPRMREPIERAMVEMSERNQAAIAAAEELHP